MSDLPNTRSEDARTVSLREFEQRHKELRSELCTAIAHEKAMRETVTEKLEEARGLNAREVLRRLDELNHAHAQAMENWARSLPRELFDQWQREYEKWRGEVGTQLTLLSSIPQSSAAHSVKIVELEAKIASLLPTISDLDKVNTRVASLETVRSKVTGAVVLLSIMGVSGVVSLILGLYRASQGR